MASSENNMVFNPGSHGQLIDINVDIQRPTFLFCEINLCFFKRNKKKVELFSLFVLPILARLCTPGKHSLKSCAHQHMILILSVNGTLPFSLTGSRAGREFYSFLYPDA